MATPAGILIQEAIAPAEQWAVTQGKGGVASDDQLLVGDIPAVGGRVAPMAGGTDAALDIVDRVARQAELSCLGGKGGTALKSNSNQEYQKSSDQFVPRKNSAMTVSSSMAAVTRTAAVDINRWPGGNQRAW